MSSRTERLVPIALSLAVTAALFTACGGDSVAFEPALSPAGEAGREIVRSAGCAACHGSNGEGGTGPKFVGLYGSTVQFRDADPVVADEAYLYEAIADPGAKRVSGYGFAMPENNLTDDEIARVIDFIRELADVPSAEADS